MEAESLEVGRRIWTSLLPLSLVFTLLFASSPLASAGDMQRDYVKYVLQVERPTVIEGVVVDNNGKGIENASIIGWAHSNIILINVRTDNNGYFRIVLPGGENHEYSLNINENHSGYNTDHPYRGFDNCTIENTIKSGEHHRLRISLNYNPFDVELEETSGSLTRGWTPYSYSYTEETKEFTGYTYEQLVGYDARVPKYRTETYISGHREESYQEWVPGYWETYQSWEKVGTRQETYQEWTPGYYMTYYRQIPVYRTERYLVRYATGTYYTYEWRSFYYHGYYYRYQVRVPHHYQYPVYETRQVLDHYETISYRQWIPGHFETRTRTVDVYDWVTRKRWISGHYETRTRQVPVYSTRTVQDGYQTIRVSSYTKEWRITVEEWDWWRVMYDGTRTFTVTTEAEAAGYWIGKTYSWGWAGSGEVISKETVYTLSNGQTVTIQPSAVWEAKTSPTEPARSDSIRNVRANYRITTTRYTVTDYSPQPWGSRQTTITATPKNGYQGDVQLVVEADSIQATLGSTRLTFSSLAQTTLTMRPHSSTSGSPHLVTIKAYDSNGRLVEMRTYDLTLNSSKPSAYTTSSTSYRDAWDEVLPPEPPLDGLPEPDFSIWVSPASVRVYRIDTPASIFDVTVGMTGGEGFSGAVKVHPGEKGSKIFVHRINGQWIPPGEDKSFWLSSGEIAELRYFISNITRKGDYYLTFRAESANQVRTATLKVEWRYH